MSLNDPATFSDCIFCDGQLDSTETHCSSCGMFNRHLKDCDKCTECENTFGIWIGEKQDKCLQHRSKYIVDAVIKKEIERPMKKYWVTQTYTQIDGRYVFAQTEDDAEKLCEDGEDWHNIDTVDYEMVATEVKFDREETY